MPYVVGGGVGALTGGTLGAMAANIFWDKPTLGKRALLAVIGATVGGATGVGVTDLMSPANNKSNVLADWGGGWVRNSIGEDSLDDP